jgi:uncharacterized protein YecE (DUF72 family)
MSGMFIGTAGWAIARDCADRFPEEGSGLERYAAVFGAVEINSSFHRPHRLSTWQRWRDSVPPDFRFSAKLPKRITHELRLVGFEDELDGFIRQVKAMGEKLAVLLVQLPPKLEFDTAIAERFFAWLRERSPAAIACEPRHASWFTAEVDALLGKWRVARVAADPARHPGAGEPGGWRGLEYWRLHGSPVIYRSSYAGRLDEYTAALRAAADAGRESWCVFDNTASSAATGDALALAQALRA